ncbi:amidase [bacterium]|nr:amidase [bacterium]
MNEYLLKSGTALARLIRDGAASSEDIVETHIRRAQSVNPTINAIIQLRFDKAREEARAADARIREKGTDGLPPFFGVPCSIKENFAFVGFPQTSGLVARKNMIATKNATCVSRLLATGAIPIGTTNVPELCMWMETENRIYGRTNNPYDPTRIVGGSSGGEGALIGSGSSPFGLGADIGGSIRLPAFFNGVFGHKATGTMIPATGQYPMAHGHALRSLSTGPIARRAEDLWTLVKAFAGPDGEDLSCVPWEVGDPHAVDVAKLRVLNVPDNGHTPVSDDLRIAQRDVATHLRSLGAAVEKTRFKDLGKSFNIWGSTLTLAGGPSFAELLGNGKAMNAFAELPSWILRKSPHTLPTLMLAATESIEKAFPARMKRFFELGQRLKDEIADALGDDGVMLFPSYSSPAPLHYLPLVAPFNFVYTGIINTLELPATQVPLGLNKKGVPTGVQVIARHGNDHLCVAVAMELERRFGGWTPPRQLGEWN